jgi:WD40 repeat protein
VLEDAQPPLNPFPGLRPFEPDETHLFFGREGQSDELLRILSRNRFVAVVGTSGSGKSSLVRAGMLPALQRGFLAGAGTSWRIAIMRPGASPIESLARALNESIPVEAGGIDRQAREVLIDTTLRENSLGLVEAAKIGNVDRQDNILVLVDQFEEIFRIKIEGAGAHSGSDEATTFVRLLLESVGRSEVPIYVAITMRSDFLGDCSRFLDLPEMLNRAQYLIPRMNREQRRDAIEGPIAVGGAMITPRLVQRLLNDVGDDPDQLPILQHALMRTWEVWREGSNGSESAKALGVSESADRANTVVPDWQNQNGARPIDFEDYERSGGLKYALSLDAENAYTSLPEPGQAIARRLFKCLAEKGLDNRETRHPTRLSEICAIAEANQADVVEVIDWFRTGQRAFLTPPAPTLLGPDSVIDISHESLIRLWSRLKDWVDEESESAKIYRRLADAAARHRQGKAPLWRDPELQLTLDWKEREAPNQAWADQYAPGFADAIAFLGSSRGARESAKWFRRGAIGTLGALTVLALALASVAYRSAREAHRLARLSNARALYVQAELLESTSEGNLDIAALLAIESARRSPTLETDALLRRATALIPKTVLTHRFSTRKEWNSLIFSDDAKFAVFTDGDCTCVLATATGKEVLRLPKGTVIGMDFSTDGRFFVTRGEDRTARVFEMASGKEIARVNQGEELTRVALSPDGHYFATSSLDGMTRIFEVRTGQQVSSSTSEGAVDDVTFSPDGEDVATTNRGGFVHVFRTVSGNEILPATNIAADRILLSFSRDGHYLATAGNDRTVRVFGPEDATEVSRLTNKEKLHLSEKEVAWKEISRLSEDDIVRDVTFSPDGRVVATAGLDRTARVFEAATGKELSRITEGDAVVMVNFSPDGRYVSTASIDHTARVFEASTGKEVFRATEDGPVWVATFNADGSHLITATVDTLNVFDAQLTKGDVRVAIVFSPTDQNGGYLGPGNAGVASRSLDTATAIGRWVSRAAVAFSREGRFVAIANNYFSIPEMRVFETRTGKELWNYTEQAFISSVAFSPGGRYVAIASGQTAQVFNATSGDEVSQLVLEDPEDRVNAVAFSPDDKLFAAGNSDKTARVFEAATGKEVSRLTEGGRVFAVAFSPVGPYVATGSQDKTVRIFDSVTGKEVSRLAEDDSVTSVAFSPDGRYVASGGFDHTVRVMEAATGKEIWRFEELDAVTVVAFSADGHFVVTGSNDKTARVFDASTGKEISRVYLSAFPSGVGFNGDGSRLVAVLDDTSQIYVASTPVATKDLIADVCSRLTHNLSPNEWKQYIPGEKYNKTCANLP